MTENIKIDTVQDNVTICKRCDKLDWLRFVVCFEQLEICQVARSFKPTVKLFLHEVELYKCMTVSICYQIFFVDDHLRSAIPVHLEFRHLALVFNVPDPMLRVYACTDYISVVDNLDLVNDGV